MSYLTKLLGLQGTAKAVEDRVTAGIYAGHAVDPSTFPIASPWVSGNLQRVMWNDMFGPDVEPPNTRTAAMSIPAVSRARNLICTALQRLPLLQLDGDTPTATQPGWITQTTDGTSPQHRAAWTADDLIFGGWSCWEFEPGGDQGPAAAGRLPTDMWEVDTDTRQVLVNGAPARNVILIPGFHEGILSFGQQAIRDTLGIYRAVSDRISTPVPPIHLRQVSGTPITDPDEIDRLTGQWARARRKGGVGFSNQHIEVVPLNTDGGDSLMIEARNAAALDLARVIGVAGSRIDATVDKASLNYETTSGRNWEFLDQDLSLYTDPIAARLSMDDWTPPGTRVQFDTSAYTTLTPGPTGPALED